MSNNYTNQNLVVGLDIGTTKIATIVGYRNENGVIDIIGYGHSESKGVEFGEIKNINYTVEGIKQSVDLADQRSMHKTTEVYVGIAGHHIRTAKYEHHYYRYDKDNEITVDEIEKITADVRMVSVPPGEEIIDVIPQQYLIDKKRQTSEPVGEMGRDIIAFYQIITGKEDEINKILLCGERANIKFKEIVLEPIASGLSCLTEDEKKGCILVDIGGGTTDMIIYVDGSPVYTKVLSIGGNIITRDISTVCKIPEEIAEKIKKKHGTCISDRSNVNNLITITRANGQQPTQISETYLAKAIQARMEEIIHAIKIEIDRSGYRSHLQGGLILTGGGAQLRGIKSLFEYHLQLNTRIGIPENGFSRSIPTELKSPVYATALGLLKYGIENEEGPFSGNDTTVNETISHDSSKKSTDKKKSGTVTHNNWGFFEQVSDWLKSFIDRIS